MENISFEQQIFDELVQVLTDLEAQIALDDYDGDDEKILVIGTSTSEVIGKRIGTSGTEQVARALFSALQSFSERTGVELAFQCCEHLNRALVIEQKVQKKHKLDKVSVIPVAKAGGSMAAYAYKQLKQPVVVEFIRADAGIDIGDTFIGMHIKHVAVPIRSRIKSIGHAHVTLAKTRPKLIGGVRAVYEFKEEGNCD